MGQKQKRKDIVRQRIESWGLSLTGVLLLALVVSIITDSEVLIWLFSLSLMVAILVFLERWNYRGYRGRSERRNTQSEVAGVAPKSGTSRLSVLTVYASMAMVLLVAGFIFSNKWSTPAYAGLTPSPWLGLFTGMVYCFVGSFAISVAAYFVHLVHQGTASACIWLAKALALTGFHCIGLTLVLNGLNVHFDTSPTTATVGKVLQIGPSGGYRSRTPMALVATEGALAPLGTMSTSLDYRIFKLDMDKKYASFYWREGWLGQRYAVEYSGR